MVLFEDAEDPERALAEVGIINAQTQSLERLLHQKAKDMGISPEYMKKVGNVITYYIV